MVDTKDGGQDPSESGKLETGRWRAVVGALFGKDGNQRGFRFSLNPSTAVARNSIALPQMVNKVNLPSTVPKYWNGKPANGKPRQIDRRMRKRNGKRDRGA